MRNSYPQGRADVVVTTIGNGGFLNRYTEIIDRQDLRDQVRIIVIADLNTPPEIFPKCQSLKTKGFQILCPSIEEQNLFLSKLGVEGLVPYRSDHRRNIGFLMSMESGSDFMVSVDDDNLPIDSTFFTEHSKVLAESGKAEIIESDSGWFNICDLATCKPKEIWPRGFPYRKRNPSELARITFNHVEIRANVGLWVGDPDVDALTRIAHHPTLTGPADQIILGPRTWTPINTQNTAIHREAMPAYYYLPMARSPEGFVIDRYGDIFSGYFVQACMKHFGHLARIGPPLVVQERNQHYLLKDLHEEVMGMLFVEDLCDWLTDLKLNGSTYSEAYLSLSHALESESSNRKGYVWTPAARAYCKQMAQSMRFWLRAVRSIEGR